MEILKTNNIENHHVFSLIVGSSGSGKTTLASTLPNDKTLIVSAESGLLSLKGFNIDYIIVKSIDDLKSLFVNLKKGLEYQHIFIDSLTEIGELIFAHHRPSFTKAQNFGLYDAYEETLVAFLKAFRDMPKYNFWLTCLDKIGSKDGVDFITLDLIKKSLSKKIPALFDEVFYLTSIEKDGEKKRVIITDNTIIDFAKDRSSKLQPFEPSDLGRIYNKIFANQGEA